MISPFTPCDLINHVVIIASGLDKTSGTIYAYVRRQSDGYYLIAAGTWQASKPTAGDVPTATYVAAGMWKYTLSSAITGALLPGDSVTCRMTDNETEASATVTSDICEHPVDNLSRNVIDFVEHQRGHHTSTGRAVYVGPVNGNDTTGNGTRALPYKTVTKALSVITTGTHATIFILADQGSSTTTLTEDITVNKRYVFIRGPGRDLIIKASSNNTPTFTVTAAGVELSGFQLESSASGSNAHGISGSGADFLYVHDIYINATQGTGVTLTNCTNARIERCAFQGTGVAATGHGLIMAISGGSSSRYNRVENCVFQDVQGDAVRLTATGGGTHDNTIIRGNAFDDSTAYGVNVGSGVQHAGIHNNTFGSNASGNILDNGTDTHLGDQYTGGLTGTIGAALTGANAPTAAAIADAVWDEALSGHLTAGTTGEALDDASNVAGAGESAVNHNYGGANALAYLTSGGDPIAGATVRVFTAAQWAAGSLDSPNGTTTTDDNGQWVKPIYLAAGNYVAHFELPYQYGPDTQSFTVT